MALTAAREALAELIGRAAGIRTALLLDTQGSLVAHADREGLTDLPLLALACRRMVREAQAAADRLAQGPPGQIVLEAERATLAILPGADGRTLCLVLAPEGIPGRALFEARRTLAALPPAP